MLFFVKYLRDGKAVGHPDQTRTVLEARQLAPEGRQLYGADLSIIVSVDDEGHETIVEKVKL